MDIPGWCRRLSVRGLRHVDGVCLQREEAQLCAGTGTRGDDRISVILVRVLALPRLIMDPRREEEFNEPSGDWGLFSGKGRLHRRASRNELTIHW